MRNFTAIYARIESGEAEGVDTILLQSETVEEASEEAETQLAIEKGTGDYSILAVVRGHPDVFDSDGSPIVETDEPDEEAELFVRTLLKWEESGQVYFEPGPEGINTISVRKTDSDYKLYRVDLTSSVIREQGGHGALPDLQEAVKLGHHAEKIRERVQEGD